ncbi:MAG: hypothetical protein JNM43_09905 [Planctomycetaceae bacterium]|nr:hypothetical protein [Planctomycetaceae bacterium]
MSSIVNRQVSHALSWLLMVTMFGMAACALPGCSLGVMFGKMFFGDPKIKCQFRSATGVDLTKGEDSILIACSAPHSILSRFPGIPIDLVDRMSRHLKTRNVKIISADDVATWFDDHGEWGDFSELAEKFKADYVMHFEMESFSCDVPDSANLQQGKVQGKITMLDTTKPSEPTVAFERAFSVSYPDYPVPKENKSEQLFRESFLDKISVSLAQILYDHRASETVN